MSWPVVLGTILLSILTHLFGSGELGLSEAAYRIFASALSALPIFLVVLIGNYLRPKNPRPAVLQQLVTFLLAGAARGFALAFLLAINPAIDDGRLDFRLPTSIITMGATLAILTFAYASYLDHKAAIAALSEETAQLSQTLEELSQAKRARDISAVAEVANRIVAELKLLELYPKERQIAEIQRLVNDQVKPLSKKYAEGLQQWHRKPATNQTESFKDIWLRLDPVGKFPPSWLIIPLSLTPVPATVAYYGLSAGVQIFLFTLIALSISIFFGRKLLKQVNARLSFPYKELSFTLVALLMAVPGVLATYLALIDTPYPYTYAVIGMIAFPTYAWVVSIGSALLADLQNSRAELVATQAQLRWAIARVNLLAWFSRGVVTRLLHGPIQNSMHITLIKMQQNRTATQIDDAIAELTKRISEAGLSATPKPTEQDLQHSLAQSIAIWEEVAEVELAATPQVLEALAHDSSAAGIVLDLCNEQVSNAIRHGKATKAEITIETKPKILKITLKHNGRSQGLNRVYQADVSGEKKDQVAGLGTRFIENCSIFFETTMDPRGLTITEIELPLETKN